VRRLLAVLALFLLAGSVFVGTRAITANSANLHAACVTGNERLAQINAKFGQLNALFDKAITRPGAQPLDPEIAKLYATFHEPIPLRKCP
jgi:hypothetical protein